MTLILELPDNKEAALKARALSLGVSVAMKAEGMTESATGDRHFEQEGFRALFRS